MAPKRDIKNPEQVKGEELTDEEDTIPPCCCSGYSSDDVPEEKRKRSLKNAFKWAFRKNSGKREKSAPISQRISLGNDSRNKLKDIKGEDDQVAGLRNGACAEVAQIPPANNNLQVTIEHVRIYPDHTHSESVVYDMKRDGVSITKSDLMMEEDSEISIASSATSTDS